MRPPAMLPLLSLTLAFAECRAEPLQAAAAPLPAMAEEAPPTLGDELREGFFARLNVFGFVLRQDTDDAYVNQPGAPGIPRTQKELDLRPDFNLKWRQLELDLKPRVQWARTRTHYADQLQRDAHGNRSFINEGSIRYRLHDRLILSYGRENLQWGPSALLSPSNPFNASNGRNNPNLELPGLDYARAVYVASPEWTVSAIANTGRGRLDPINLYRKAYAAKIDYTGEGHYYSLLVSRAEGEGTRIGGFAGWDLSDALSLHAEGSAGTRREGRLSDRRDRQLLVGATYTFEHGGALALEYFHRSDGCGDVPIQSCVALQGSPVDPVHPLLRRRYAMLQYTDTRIADRLNLVLRLVRNLDDQSSQLVVNLELELGNHWQVYAIPTFYHGKRDSEFGSLLRRSFFVGASYTF